MKITSADGEILDLNSCEDKVAWKHRILQRFRVSGDTRHRAPIRDTINPRFITLFFTGFSLFIHHARREPLSSVEEGSEHSQRHIFQSQIKISCTILPSWAKITDRRTVFYYVTRFWLTKGHPLLGIINADGSASQIRRFNKLLSE